MFAAGTRSITLTVLIASASVRHRMTMEGLRMQREVLTIRDRGVEALLAKMPYDLGADGPDVRRFATVIVNDASRFQVNKAKQNALARGGRND